MLDRAAIIAARHEMFLDSDLEEAFALVTDEADKALGYLHRGLHVGSVADVIVIEAAARRLSSTRPAVRFSSRSWSRPAPRKSLRRECGRPIRPLACVPSAPHVAPPGTPDDAGAKMNLEAMQKPIANERAYDANCRVSDETEPASAPKSLRAVERFSPRDTIHLPQGPGAPFRRRGERVKSVESRCGKRKQRGIGPGAGTADCRPGSAARTDSGGEEVRI